MNCASRLTSTRPLLISSNRYAFSCSEYPRNRQRTDRASNVRFSFGTVTYAWQPNTLRLDSSGFLPVQTWCGDLPWLVARVGHRFQRNVAVIAASPQYDDSNAVMRNWYDSLRLARSVITKSSSLTGAPTASSCSASVLTLLMCSSTSSPSPIIVVKKRRRRKSFGNCESSIARQMIASALRDFLLNVDWSSAVVQCSSLISPLVTSHRSRSSSTMRILNFHVWKLVPSNLLMREVVVEAVSMAKA
ncbi:Hypothetical protein PHPALM_17983 [Phytophthora palmivora]|uniref:Uncharacterized protein n=1 Tax=Phytophthora palmivora TaxID=4796 RepID=A0A2P4XKV8_9STRA|nr:Hypothetical protein PHPALM_17983 [Phytophthora palmivora]